MNQSLSYEQLQHQNVAFRGTAGVSSGNRTCGFVPAFFDTDSKIVHISRFSNGMPAPIHLLDGLPEVWVRSRDAVGHVTALTLGFGKDLMKGLCKCGEGLMAGALMNRLHRLKQGVQHIGGMS